MKKLVFSVLFGCVTVLLNAQQPLELKGNVQQETLHVNIDSIALSTLGKAVPVPDSLVNKTNIEYRLLPDRSYYESNPLFSDLIFTGMRLSFNPPLAPVVAQMNKSYQSYDKNVSGYFSPDFYVMRYMDSLREQQKEKLIASDPLKIKDHMWNLPDPNEFVITNIASPGHKDMYIRRKLDQFRPRKMKVNGLEKDPWSTKGNLALQLSQNYTSSNWYQGGKSNLATLGVLEASANYDNQKNIQWDNSVSMKMGLQSESADTIRHYSVTENQIRLSSKFGLKAFENWYYSFSGEFTTYSLTAYSALNSRTKVNGFLKPFRLDLGIGMDYKYKQQLSVLVTPLSFKYVCFTDTMNYNKANFGILPGENSLHEFGSMIKVEYNKKLSSTVDLTTRFSYYTNYKKIEVDWETTTNFILTRYLSFRLSLHPRYDTAVIASGDKHAKIHMKELMSFGFAYKFNNIKAKNKPLH
ncbi:MAG: DUF3078 domain-containing protein [Bacteroidota bacterium]|nr:DUF3078 domain-containing protein [Bacteroidota bacterium]